MKVLHVVPSFYPALHYGGPIESVYALCREVSRRGADVRVLTTDANGLDKVLDVEKDREVILRENLSVRYCRRLARHSVSLELLRSLMEYVRWADVIHLTAVYSFPTIPTLLACRIAGKPIIWSPRGALQRWQGSKKLARKQIWQSLCALAAPGDLVLHVTSEKEAIESQNVFPWAQTCVIANGVEVSASPKVRQSVGALRLVFLGRLDPKKGIENLLEACAWLQQKSRLAFSLTIAGAGEPTYERALRSRINADLADKVKMIGAVYGNAKEELLDAAAMVIVPSYTENFALVVAEALAHGVPVIASKGTPWEKLEENRCGLWVDNDPQSLASAIERMAAMELVEMGQRARQWMQREFSWRARANEMIKIYQESLRWAPQALQARSSSSAQSAHHPSHHL